MSTLHDILPLVEKPSRYLGSEINRVFKDPDSIKLHMALAYPDLYEIGTSHFGIQILYHILNHQPDIFAEVVFAPAVDMAAHLRQADLPLMSLESKTPLKQFDMIGFSLLYELNFTNVLFMMELSGIPFFTTDRDESFPLIIGGGPCTVNPEPVAEFFDALVIGDGESVILQMAAAWLQWKDGGSKDKESLLLEWSNISGVYVPSLFDALYDASGFQTLKPRYGHSPQVKRAIVPNLDTAPFPVSPVVPFGKPVHDRLRLEVARGCTRGCRFCQAGMIYRPVRERAPETLLDIYEKAVSMTGYDDLSLLSLSTGDYGCIVPLMEQLMNRCGHEHVAVSLPSLRAGTLTPEMMRLIRKVRKTGFTIAPEAGSQRLRDVINKDITEADIVKTVGDAFELGWKVIKLYFMIGLPTEKDEDLRAIVDLVTMLRKVMRSKQSKRFSGKINVSVATFVPKPHTPFQWAGQDDFYTSREKIQWVRQHLHKSGVHVKWQDPRVSRLEGLWARGDRRLGKLLVAAYGRGCKFDGWSDHFDDDAWTAAIAESQVDVDFYTTRQRALAEPLPWDHVDTGVSRGYLGQEWSRAVKGEFTPDCRNGACNECGVCDFDVIAPVVFDNCHLKPRYCKSTGSDSEPTYRRLMVYYAKTGPARFFGHLELATIFFRSIRRAKIPIKFSEGFHPKPKIAFDDPLPVGMESVQEVMWLSAAAHITPDQVHRRLNDHLPEGVRVTACQAVDENTPFQKPAATTYTISLKDGKFEENKIKCFLEKPQWVFQRVSRKGRVTTMDLKESVSGLERIASDCIRMTIATTTGATVRPIEVMTQVFLLSEMQCKTASIIKEKVLANV